LKDLILGLDPGSRHTGYGVIAADGENLTYVSHGVIDLKENWSLGERLRVLHLELDAVFAKFAPKTAVIEKIFFGKNADSAFKLGHARGVCLLSATQNGAFVEEYAARFVKKCITGSGAADKGQVQTMVFAHLRVQPIKLAFDATDALSLAVTHARMRGIDKRIKNMLEGEGAP
jgi:crossover junction endodeoxyribonuclease RuvC